jgi:hypothetical protein
MVPTAATSLRADALDDRLRYPRVPEPPALSPYRSPLLDTVENGDVRAGHALLFAQCE